MRVRFWGVRGSVPWTTAQSVGHGCNTPCIELTDEASGDSLVLDAGTGIVGLGEELAGSRRSVSILLTHYHWDHVQGLPFFQPLYEPASAPVIWAPVLDAYDPAWLGKVFDSPFFPVPLDRLRDRPRTEVVTAGRGRVGAFEFTAFPLNHPGGAFAYRLKGARGDLVYASDHELGNSGIDEALCEFVRGASAVIFDSHFTPAEMPAYEGWGHSDWAGAARLCTRAAVQRLFLFHHKPGRSDVELAQIETQARTILGDSTAAVEGATFDV